MADPAPERLSERETEVARSYADGQTYKEIARELGISPSTVRTHLNTIYRKLEVTRRVELMHRLDDLPRSADPARAPVPAPERRQLTIMFVDLVGSTALAARLDPEELRDLLRSYRDAVRRVVERFGGHTAGFPGDGVIACFGWPRALEDAAQRAVQAALAVVEGIRTIPGPDGVALAARIGIATGVVVVDDISGSADGLTGATPNLAARLQSAAEPGAIMIAESTREIVGDLFEVENCGSRAIHGLAEPVAVFRVHGENANVSRFKARQRGLLPQMVGRDHELSMLLDRWEQARDGTGQAVLLSGEPGIGKSRLAAALVEAAAEAGAIVVTYQASPQQLDSPLWPIRRQLVSAARLADAADAADQLHRLAMLLRRAVAEPGDALSLLAELLDIEVTHPRPAASASRKRERLLAVLVDQLLGLARTAPVLVLFEDAHWIDPTTLQVLQLAMGRISDARVLMLLTTRPDAEPAIGGYPHLTRMTLSRLNRADAAAIIGRLAGQDLDQQLVAAVLARSDGNPLYVEELTKAALDTGTVAAAVPTSLQDSLMARLDRLDQVKEVAQIASCIGREFSPDLVAAVAGRDGALLGAAFDRLVTAELVFRKGPLYVFKHALVQDAAYDSLLRVRRAELHRRIAEALLGLFPALAAAEPQTVARHLAEAGRREAAIDYYLRAAGLANDRGANREAESYLNRSLALNVLLPPGRERDQREVAVLTMLGRVLVASEGHGSRATAEVYERALRLCEAKSLGLTAFPIVLGLAIQAAVSGHQQRALALSRRLAGLVEHVDDPVRKVKACYALGITHAWRGELVAANEQFEEGLRLYSPEQHQRHLALYGQDPGVVCGCRGALTLWQLGYPDRAAEAMAAARALAHSFGHPFSINYMLCWAAWLAVEVDGEEAARPAVAATLAYAKEQDFTIWLSIGLGLRARVMLACDGPSKAAAAIDEALDRGRRTGQLCLEGYLMALAGSALCRRGEIGAGLARIDAALRLVRDSGTRWPEVEVLRCRAQGELAQQGATAAAERTLLRAIKVAREQRTRMLELRASRDLARVWAARGQQERARHLLAPLCSWFTEGLETRDLVAARAQLDALG